jgi:hypothetical protein
MINQIQGIYPMSETILIAASLLPAAAAVFFLLRFLEGLHALRPTGQRAAAVNMAGRYHPMLRLLAEDDFAFVASNPVLYRRLRAERRLLFRGYLRCLTRDYGRLLEGIRLVMVQSQVDRPDLARALARNRVLFAVALCRIEFRLALHWAGVGKVDISGVVEAFDRLREHAGAISTVPEAA